MLVRSLFAPKHHYIFFLIKIIKNKNKQTNKFKMVMVVDRIELEQAIVML